MILIVIREIWNYIDENIILNWNSFIILETIKICEKKVQDRFEMLSTKCVYKSYIFNIYE